MSERKYLGWTVDQWTAARKWASVDPDENFDEFDIADGFSHVVTCLTAKHAHELYARWAGQGGPSSGPSDKLIEV